MGIEIKGTSRLGYYFIVVSGNGKTIATSKTYTSKSACLNGVESLRKAAINGLKNTL